MKRRSFVQGAAGVVGGEILSSHHSAAAQSTPVQASRTAHLVDSSIQPGNLVCQDVIFDGNNFLWLYGPKSPPLPNRPYSIAATSVNGELLWQYALPKGGHISLGTHSGMVLSLAMPTNSPTEPRTPAPVWSLDPSTGNITAAGYNNFQVFPSYAGDSLFFGVGAGLGQIWTFDGAFAAKESGIKAQCFAGFSSRAPVSTDVMAVVTADGNWLAWVSLSDGAVNEVPISGAFVSSVRVFYQSLAAKMSRGGGPSQARLAQPVVISAVGGDQNGNAFALVVTPTGGNATTTLVQLAETGVATALATLQLPASVSGQRYMPSKLFATNSEICILSRAGDLAWYPLA